MKNRTLVIKEEEKQNMGWGKRSVEDEQGNHVGDQRRTRNIGLGQTEVVEDEQT